VSKNSEIRKQKVVFMTWKGESETNIAKKLGVSRATIVRDVKQIRSDSQNWIDDLAKGGFIFEYRFNLEKIKQTNFALQELLAQTDDVSQKIKILKAMDNNTKLYLQLLGEAPTIYALKKANQEIP